MSKKKPNAFEILGQKQRKIRQTASDYALFIRLGVITVEEAWRLFEWFMGEGDIGDNSGKIRCMLLKHFDKDKDTIL